MGMLLSMEIRPEKIVLVEGQDMKGNLVVEKVISLKLPKGKIVNSAIVDFNGMEMTLKELIHQNNIKTKNVAVTLDIGNMLIRDFEIPFGKPAEMAGMIKSEMIQNYSASESDAIEFKKIAETHEDGLKKVKVRATALSTEIIKGYYNLLNGLKLKPVSMDSNANAIEKLFAKSTQINGLDKGEESFVVLDFGCVGTTIHAVQDGNVQLSRFTALGLKDLNEFVSGKINQFGERGEYIDQIDFESQEQTPINVAANNFMSQWCSEIQKVIKFTLLRLDTNEISNMYIIGEGSQIPGIIDLISKNLFINVTKIDSLTAVSFKREEDKTKLYECINATGALLRI
jgi:type IV pilus assembly protein PilM